MTPDLRSQVRHSSSALLNYLKSITGDLATLDPFTSTLLDILRGHSQVIRVTLPFLKTLDLLLSNGAFDLYNTMETLVNVA